MFGGWLPGMKSFPHENVNPVACIWEKFRRAGEMGGVFGRSDRRFGKSVRRFERWGLLLAGERLLVLRWHLLPGFWLTKWARRIRQQARRIRQQAKRIRQGIKRIRQGIKRIRPEATRGRRFNGRAASPKVPRTKNRKYALHGERSANLPYPKRNARRLGFSNNGAPRLGRSRNGHTGRCSSSAGPSRGVDRRHRAPMRTVGFCVLRST